MKVINRKSKEIIDNNRRSEQQFFVTAAGRYIQFTATTADFCGITKDSFVQFMNEGSDWHFFIDDNPDGFNVTEHTSAASVRPSFRVNSTGLVKMLLKSTGFKETKRYAVERTNQYHDRCPIFKLSLDNVPTVIR